MWDLTVHWSGLGAETKAALIGAIATFGTGFLGFGAVFWQMRAQGRANRESVAENERRRLKAAMYEETIQACAAVVGKTTAFSNSLRVTGQMIKAAAAAHSSGKQFPPPQSRFSEISRHHGEMMEAAVEFIFMIERRQIIDPRIMVFRTAMNAAIHDIRELFYFQFVPAAIPTIPVDLPDGRVVFNPLPVAAAEGFEQLATTLADLCGNITSYVEDFLVSMQNSLLGDLFDTEAQYRQPIDPNSRVIRLDHHEVLENYFMTETAWGKSVAQVEAETRARFA